MDLRNAIAHSDYRGGLPIATPRIETVEAIEKLALQFENPPRVDRYMTRDALVAQMDDALVEHLRRMTASSISQVPVYHRGEFKDLLTTNAIARWVGAHMDDGGDVIAEAVRVSDIVALVEEHEFARFVSKRATAMEVCGLAAGPRPSDVKAWTVQLAESYAPSTVYAIYRRLAQIMGDAVHDGIIPRSPCSRRTSPGQAKQRPYVATTEQVWALHDAFPEHLRPAILLGAFAGLRVAETAALRTIDVDFMRGVVSPEIQYPNEPLKSATSRNPVLIPSELALMLASFIERFGGETVVTDELGRPTTPWAIERAMRAHRGEIEGLPEGFRFHDLRHYFASLLIGSGLDVKVVQTRLRHASATTTLNTYGHLWPDADESARAAVAAVIRHRADSLRTVGS